MHRIIWVIASITAKAVMRIKKKLMNGIEKQRNKVMLMRRKIWVIACIMVKAVM